MKKSLFKRRLWATGSLVVLSTLLVLLTQSVAIAPKAAHAATSAPVLYEVRLNQQNGLRSIWKYPAITPTGWQEIGTPNPTHLASQAASVVATTSRVYQLQVNGNILVYSGTSTTWTTLDASGTAEEIALSSTGQLYKEDRDSSAWKYSGGTSWTQLSSSANSAPLGPLIAGPNGALYSMGVKGVWQYTGTPITGWQKIDNTLMPDGYSDAVLQAATPNGKLYELRFNATTNISTVWAYNGTPLSWKQISTQASVAITGDGQSHLYRRGSGGWLWRYNGSGTSWTALKSPSPTQLTGLTTNSAGQVFELLSTGTIWELNDLTWTRLIDSPTTSFLIASDVGGSGFNGVG